MKKKTTAEEANKEEEIPEIPQDITNDEVVILNGELDIAKAEIQKLNETLLRTAAEYDNYRKRSMKERESVFADAYDEAVTTLIPSLDNLERALSFGTENPQALNDGLLLTVKQFQDGFKTLGVEEIPTNEGFNPELHNAVLHIEDESLGENVVVEVFQKGYKIGDKVIRHSLVKVAN
jgi:molecular chaperone GrpE